MTNKVVYLHSRKDNNNVFYVGIGSLERAYSKAGRNNWWTKIAKKVGFNVHVLCKNLTSQEAKLIEIALIRRYKNMGMELCNMTQGGDGRLGGTQSEEWKKNHSQLLMGNSYGLGIPVKEPIIAINLKNKETIKFVGRKAIVNYKIFDVRSVYRCANKDKITPTFAKGIHREHQFFWESEYLRKVGIQNNSSV
jgi:hypothetical protein